MNDTIFLRPPLNVEDGIPVFSTVDAYINNYENISRDHLHHLERFGHSQFMVDDQIQDSENATRRLVKRYLAEGSKLLDVGVGTGSLLSGLPEYNRYGVDIALPYLKFARDKGIKTAMSKVAELPYLDNYFDGITACDVLEHLIDLDESVAQLTRVLKPGGILIVRVPNAEDLSHYISDENYEWAHVRSFTYESLRLYFEKCFNYIFLESAYCAKSFYVSTQLLSPAPKISSKVRTLLPELLRQAESSNANCIEALRSLEKNLILTLEEQVDALILLRDQYPEVLAALSETMIRPAELLCVFRKPSDN